MRRREVALPVAFALRAFVNLRDFVVQPPPVTLPVTFRGRSSVIMESMTTTTPVLSQASDSLPGGDRRRGLLSIARAVAVVFMVFCIAAFVWGLLLFPRYGLANLDSIRPNDNWSDATLLAVIASAGLSVAGLGYTQLAVTVLATLSMVAVGPIVFWRRADSWFGLYVGVLFVWFGTQANFVTDPVAQVQPLLAPINDALGTSVWLAFFPLLYLFPDGRFVPRWTGWLLPVWLGLMTLFSLQLLPDSLAFAPVAMYLLLGLVSQGYRFARRSNPVQRQQTKWVLFSLGFVVVMTIWAGSILAASQSEQQFTVRDLWVSTVAITLFTVSLAALPISIGIAILRYRLWDIDVIIRKTLVYTAVTALLALVYFGSVVLLQRLVGALTGAEQSSLAVVVSTLAIAALFTPLRRRIQDGIDRRFFRKKYDAQRVLAQFAVTARDETDLEALTGELARVVQETLQPERVSVWLRETRSPNAGRGPSR